MTSDSTLLHRPTEALILPTKRRFFPFKIPNFHTQLRNYISTADPDRIYVVVERIVYSIHISAQKRESVAVLPFEPRCLVAGYGWIVVGGPENGECAFIRIGDRGMQVHGDIPFHADVDSALPLDLDPPSSIAPGDFNGESASTRYRSSRLSPEVELHGFGGSIVNSVTIHRFYGGSEDLADEDIVVLSNNDRTVTVYSLTRAKVLTVLHHPTCMNYATISPDSKLLTAVGDENHAYFYEITRDLESSGTTESGKKLTGWEWELINRLEMNIGLRADDACCFTVAFSPSSRLCAIGSQSGIITIIDVESIYKNFGDSEDDSAILCQFPASRSCTEGGAVRCMAFSPEPWDLLVWLEGHGRAGVADVRQHFMRRQILHLDSNDPKLQEVYTDFSTENLERHPLGDDILETPPRVRLENEDFPIERNGEQTERSSLRESLIQDLSERERLIMEFLNTARWTSRLEEGLTERLERPARAGLPPQLVARPQNHGSTDGTARIHRPTSPLHRYDSSDVSRDSHLGRTVSNPRHQSSVVVSQGSRRPSEASSSHHDRQSDITLSYSTSHSALTPLRSEMVSRGSANPETANNETSIPAEATGSSNPSLDTNGLNHRPQRSSSIPRRIERPQTGAERRYDTSRLTTYEIRANVAAERLRRQRQIANEVHNRSFEREQRHRQQLLGFEQTHSPRWIRNIINDLPDRNSMHGCGAEEPDSTAGVGWGADGRTLYIATLEGVFEFSLNIHDRKTFPKFSCR
ncbi:uncharacterized protein N7518_007684 [Penicillium psychrosexuale]|uniref:uncharacterized protein n=1 Tax=Penicillium psychrosexuale TaxID=1002107 RepID=UPI0025458EBD|nr:uncharacterized protein N7518_007684 [Penicillium psychrosexuale]KAJ5790673.1 hypothetical protein N7518_007684 [Penicillium psychrosexuale]